MHYAAFNSCVFVIVTERLWHSQLVRENHMDKTGYLQNHLCILLTHVNTLIHTQAHTHTTEMWFILMPSVLSGVENKCF